MLYCFDSTYTCKKFSFCFTWNGFYMSIMRPKVPKRYYTKYPSFGHSILLGGSLWVCNRAASNKLIFSSLAGFTGNIQTHATLIMPPLAQKVTVLHLLDVFPNLSRGTIFQTGAFIRLHTSYKVFNVKYNTEMHWMYSFSSKFILFTNNLLEVFNKCIMKPTS